MSKAEEFKGFGCDGSNLSPALEWKGAPEGTKSFAVTLYDTTAHFWHWTIFDIPAGQKGLAAGAGDTQKGLAPKGSIQGKNDYGLMGFGGPCPPKGDKPHTYIYTVYALKVAKLGLDKNEFTKKDPNIVEKLNNYELQHCIYYAHKMVDSTTPEKVEEGKTLLRKVFDELDRRGMKGLRPAAIDGKGVL